MKKQNRYMLPVFLFLTAVAFTFTTAGCRKKTEEPVKRPVVSGVKVQSVSLSKVDNIYEVTGTVKSSQTSLIASRVMGMVNAVNAKEGDYVRQGQLLLTIDDRDAVQRVRAARMAVESAKQNQVMAEKTWQRYKKLFDESVVSLQEMDRVETQKKIADAEYDRMKAMAEEAETYMSFTKVTAPASGRITEKRIEAGSMAAPGMPLFVMEAEGGSYIEVAIDSGAGNSVRRGMAVQAEVETENRPVDGIIREVFPSVDPVSHTFTAKIGFRDLKPRSGLFARVSIPLGRKDAIVVPAQAVVQKGQLTGVYAVDGQGLVSYRLVRTGKVFVKGTEILSGLKAGDRIITAGVERVIDGGMIEGEGVR